jgi:hypothetical protein
MYSTLTTKHLSDAITVLYRVAYDKEQSYELQAAAMKAAVALEVNGLGQRVEVREEA